jgi:hypothetical protein
LTTVYVLNSVHPRDLMPFKDCLDFRHEQKFKKGAVGLATLLLPCMSIKML